MKRDRFDPGSCAEPREDQGGDAQRGYNIVTGKIGQTPPPRPTLVDPTAAGLAEKRKRKQVLFRNLDSTFDRFA